MLQGAASTDVRRTSVWRRAATGLLAVGVCVATGLGAASVDTASGPVTQAALDSSPSSLVGLTAGPLPSSAAARDLPGPAAVVDTTGAGRLARPALAAGDIPPAAWEAYLRAAAVLAKAAPRCGLDWTVLAAIGLVESDHGRSSTGTGVDGRRRTAPDTDGGRLDGDPARDITVGPMRLLPSTWQVIGVDGDGDGIRSPADPDDAALAVGVALCAGDAHLGTRAGLRRALLRYAPSPAYVDLVIRIARSYAQAASPAPTATVATIAHPVVDGARTTLARRSLARRVEAAGSATVKSVGVGSSPSAQLLSTALASHSPPSATAAGPTTAGPTTAGPTAASPTTEASSASPSTAAPSTPAPSAAAPSTPAPSAAAPSTPAPSAAAPSTPAPSAAAPSTPAPSATGPTAAEPTQTPATAAETMPTSPTSSAGPAEPTASAPSTTKPAAAAVDPSAEAAATPSSDPTPTCPIPDPAAPDAAPSVVPSQEADQTGDPAAPTDPCAAALSRPPPVGSPAPTP